MKDSNHVLAAYFHALLGLFKELFSREVHTCKLFRAQRYSLQKIKYLEQKNLGPKEAPSQLSFFGYIKMATRCHKASTLCGVSEKGQTTWVYCTQPYLAFLQEVVVAIQTEVTRQQLLLLHQGSPSLFWLHYQVKNLLREKG